MMDVDYEIDAMRTAYSALDPVSPVGRHRALAWLEARFEAEHIRGCDAGVAVARFAREIRRRTSYRPKRRKAA